MTGRLNGSRYRIVFLLLLSIFIVTFSPAADKSVTAQNWQKDRLMLDLQNGGAELFSKVAPSCVQIFNLDYEQWSGSSGSGYVIDKLGHAITNKHVVGDSQLVEIAFFGNEDDGKRHKALVVGCDPQLDLAVIKIQTDPSNLVPIKMADSDTVKIGDVVATLGSPGGDAGVIDPGDRNFGSQNWLDFFNFNIGVVDEIIDFPQASYFYSAYHNYFREMYGEYYGSGVQYLFHVSAAINHGNSGGPCINAKGEVIGTNTWGGGSENNENLGFSVPTNLLKRSAAEIIKHGKPQTPWCGIICHPAEIPFKWGYIDSQLGLTNKYQLWFDPQPEELNIYHVNPYSPAYEAGLRTGDTVLSVDGIRFENVFDLYKYLLNGRVGDEVTFMVERDNRGLAPVTVELSEKQVRYDSVVVDTVSMYGKSRPYRVGLTY